MVPSLTYAVPACINTVLEMQIFVKDEESIDRFGECFQSRFTSEKPLAHISSLSSSFFHYIPRGNSCYSTTLSFTPCIHSSQFYSMHSFNDGHNVIILSLAATLLSPISVLILTKHTLVNSLTILACSPSYRRRIVAGLASILHRIIPPGRVDSSTNGST